MKLRIGEYEVEVTAVSQERSFGEELDTGYFLNQLSIDCGDAYYFNRECYPGLAEAVKKRGYDIYNALKAAGFYEEV